MTSKFKVLTDNTPPSSSGVSTEALVQQSKQSPSSDNTEKSTPTTSQLLSNMLSPAKSALTTPKITEKSRQHAELMPVGLIALWRAGLVKRYRVRATTPDGKIIYDNTGKPVVRAYRFEFDASLWTEDIELRVLSE